MRLVTKTHLHILALTAVLSASVPSAVRAGSVTLTDPGSFQVLFGGSVATPGVPELSAEAMVHFLDFTQTATGGTEGMFDITLSNTISGSLESRVAAFDSDKHTDPISGTVTGLLNSAILNGVANQFGGIFTGDSDSFLLTLFLSGSVDRLTLDNFGVRYQSINGASINGTTANRTDALTGSDSTSNFNPDANVPEPGGLLLLGMGLLAFGATMRRRRSDVGAVQPETLSRRR